VARHGELGLKWIQALCVGLDLSPDVESIDAVATTPPPESNVTST